MPRALLLLLLALLAPAAPAADLSISLPLGPWYRVGKYLPVHVSATNAEPVPTRTLTLSSDTAAARTTMDASGGRIDAVVPYLISSPRPPRLALLLDDGSPAVNANELRPLADNDRLVALTTPDESSARQLIGPGARVVPVLVDPELLLKTDPAAWDVLDALLLDAATATRLREAQLASFLASGVTVAVRTTQPPFPAWPWKQQGEYAVLNPTLAGPQTGAYFDAAYLPVSDWQPGHPWPHRRRILVVAALCCLPFLALVLWRPRFTPAWAILISALLCFALVRWQRTVLAPRLATGDVFILHPGGVTQWDQWTYMTSPVATTLRIPWHLSTRPVTSSDVAVTVVCDVGGHPAAVRAQAEPHRKVAFLSRAVGLQTPRAAPAKPVTSPLAPLVDAAYLGDGARTLGQLPAPTVDESAGRTTWNSVVVERVRP